MNEERLYRVVGPDFVAGGIVRSPDGIIVACAPALDHLIGRSHMALKIWARQRKFVVEEIGSRNIQLLPRREDNGI